MNKEDDTTMDRRIFCEADASFSVPQHCSRVRTYVQSTGVLGTSVSFFFFGICRRHRSKSFPPLKNVNRKRRKTSSKRSVGCHFIIIFHFNRGKNGGNINRIHEFWSFIFVILFFVSASQPASQSVSQLANIWLFRSWRRVNKFIKKHYIRPIDNKEI